MQTKKAKQRRRIFVARLLIFLIAVILLTAVVCALASGCIFLSAALNGFSFADKYSVYYGKENNFKIIEEKDEDTDEVKVRVKLTDFSSRAYKVGEIADNDALYVDFSSLAEYCGFVVSGQADRIRYILPGTEGRQDSYFVAYPDSNRIELNGRAVYLSAPAILSDGSLYLPIEFVDRYVHGISVETVEGKENVYYLLCSQTSDFFVTASEPTPDAAIDRSALDELTEENGHN